MWCLIWSWKFSIIPKLRNVCNVFLVRLSWHFYHAVPFPDNPCTAYSSTWYRFIFMYHPYHSNVNVYLIHEAQYLVTSVHLQHAFIYMVYGVLLVFMFNCFFMYPPLGFHRVDPTKAAWCQRVVPPTKRLQAALPLREEPGVIQWWVRDLYRWVSLHRRIGAATKNSIMGFVVVGIWHDF